MRLRTIPNAKSFSAAMRDGVLVVRVPAKAVDGEANKALEKELSKRLGAKIRITAGFKSREKTISMEGLSEEDALRKIGVM